MREPVAFAVDPVEAMIRGSGWLRNPDLWRQWIFTQMIRACQARDMDAFRARFVDSRPYAYQWETAIREIKMHVKASRGGRPRPLFFPFPVLLRMLSDYESSLEAFFRNPKRQRRDGTGIYASVKGKRIYLGYVQGEPCSELYLRRARKAKDGLRRAKKDGSYAFALSALERFKSTAMLDAALPKSQAWLDAFAANGAYYTMDNLIRFHGFRLPGLDGKPLSLDASLRKLEAMPLTIGEAPDAMFDVMSGLLDANPGASEQLLGSPSMA